MPEGKSQFGFKITAHIPGKSPVLRNVNGKQFRYSGVDKANIC